MGRKSRTAAMLLAMVAVNAATGQARTCTYTNEKDTDNWGKSRVGGSGIHAFSSIHATRTLTAVDL